jgi:hypothetical protein
MSAMAAATQQLPPFIWQDGRMPALYSRALGAAGLGVSMLLSSYRNADNQC